MSAEAATDAAAATDAGRMGRDAPPPGTLFAAGTLIGTAVVFTGVMMPAARERLLGLAFHDPTAILLWIRDLLTIAFSLGMLAFGASLLFLRVRWVPWALGLVVANGLALIAGLLLPDQAYTVSDAFFLTLIPLAPLVWV